MPDHVPCTGEDLVLETVDVELHQIDLVDGPLGEHAIERRAAGSRGRHRQAAMLFVHLGGARQGPTRIDRMGKRSALLSGEEILQGCNLAGNLRIELQIPA